MKLRCIKKQSPRPRPYSIGASVRVPEFDGPFGWPMDSVRLTIKGSCQTGEPDHRVCMRHIHAARERYLATLPARGSGETERERG